MPAFSYRFRCLDLSGDDCPFSETDDPSFEYETTADDIREAKHHLAEHAASSDIAFAVISVSRFDGDTWCNIT